MVTLLEFTVIAAPDTALVYRCCFTHQVPGALIVNGRAVIVPVQAS